MKVANGDMGGGEGGREKYRSSTCKTHKLQVKIPPGAPEQEGPRNNINQPSALHIMYCSCCREYSVPELIRPDTPKSCQYLVEGGGNGLGFLLLLARHHMEFLGRLGWAGLTSGLHAWYGVRRMMRWDL